MPDRLQDIRNRLRQRLAELYGERLRGVYVFGSHARGDAGPGSDLDVLIVLDRVDTYRSEIHRTSHLIAELSLESGISLSRVFVPEAEWLGGQSPFLANVRREAVPA
jgi:predicted nucleotidyltransferase